MKQLVLSLVLMAMAGGPLMAKPPLRDVQSIDDALLDLGVADLIRKNCPDIRARMFRAIRYVRNLESEAKALGYSDAEIEAYIENDAEKARMRKRGDVFFAQNGVDTSDPQSYCALGHAEIQKESRIGSLLKAK